MDIGSELEVELSWRRKLRLVLRCERSQSEL